MRATPTPPTPRRWPRPPSGRTARRATARSVVLPSCSGSCFYFLSRRGRRSSSFVLRFICSRTSLVSTRSGWRSHASRRHGTSPSHRVATPCHRINIVNFSRLSAGAPIPQDVGGALGDRRADEPRARARREQSSDVAAPARHRRRAAGPVAPRLQRGSRMYLLGHSDVCLRTKDRPRERIRGWSLSLVDRAVV